MAIPGIDLYLPQSYNPICIARRFPGSLQRVVCRHPDTVLGHIKELPRRYICFLVFH